MPTCKIQWWLWNQMFQYALAYSLAKKYDEHIFFDPYELESRFFLANWTFRKYELDVFDIEKMYIVPYFLTRKYIHPKIISYIKKFLLRDSYICEKDGKFIENFPRNAYLDGWFQSYKYFDAYKSDIVSLFTVRTPISPENQLYLDMIEENKKNVVSLHVRRGDYVTLKNANRWHGVCSLSYYDEAIALCIENISTPIFFVFSDDILWCRENLTFPKWVVVHYIDHNGWAGYEDLRLMYSCHHHIIANSSFSWWWAYLGRNPEKIVLAPKKWLESDTFNTKYLIPPTWKLI